MAQRKAEIASRLHIRRGLSEGEAALYIGVGATKFAQLVAERRMPRARLIDGRRVWDVDDLDAAFKALPFDGDTLDQSGANPWHD